MRSGRVTATCSARPLVVAEDKGASETSLTQEALAFSRGRLGTSPHRTRRCPLGTGSRWPTACGAGNAAAVGSAALELKKVDKHLVVQQKCCCCS